MNAPVMLHNELASSLAAHLRQPGSRRRLTWENITFNCGDGADAWSCRPDVFSIVPALDSARTQPWTCEVKVSRADFLSDIRSEKWKRYRRFSCRIWFAAPAGMIEVSELPQGVGLYVFGQDGWKPIAKPKFCKGWQLSDRDLMRLILGKWGTYADLLHAQNNQ